MKKHYMVVLLFFGFATLAAEIQSIPLFKIFHAAASGAPTENTLLSPWGIQECFGIVSPGAGQSGAAELSRYLGLTPARSVEMFRARQSLRKSKVDFNSFNAAFLNNKYKIVPEYSAQVRKLYNGSLSGMDFSRPKECADQMNSIVKRESRSMFDNVFSEQMLSNNPVIILLNILYFNSTWAETFDKKLTRQEQFTVTPLKDKSRHISVQMMNDTRSVPYFNNGTIHGITLDYRDRRFKLLALTTADSRKPLSLVTEYLAKHGLSDVLRNSSAQNKTVIKLPKLKLSGEIDLKKLFSSIGMKKIFDPRYGALTQMVKGESLYISDAKQFVKLDLDEEKTELSAVTYAAAVGCALSPDPPKYNYFYADHPFVLVLFDSRTQAVLLTAAVVKP